MAAVDNSPVPSIQPARSLQAGGRGLLAPPSGAGPRAPSVHLPRSSPSRKDVDAPACCNDCNEPWPFPRYVDFLAEIPKDMRKDREAKSFPATCPEFIVAYQSWDRQTQKPIFSEEVYENISLVHSRKVRGHIVKPNRLVEDFEYNRETGACSYAGQLTEEDEMDKFRYGRLVTLNSWYSMLIKRLLLAVLDTFSIAGTVIFFFQLSLVWKNPDLLQACANNTAVREVLGHMDEEQREKLYKLFGIFDGTKHNITNETQWCMKSHSEDEINSWWRLFHFKFLIAFGVICFVLYGIAFWCAWKNALWEWDILASPKVGDLVVKCHWSDLNLAFTAMVLFNFFTVEKMVKDLPVFLHPWKGVQPYSAIKIENSRAYLLGFKSRSLFQVETHSGQLGVIAWLTVNKTLQLVYKSYLLFEVGQGHVDVGFRNSLLVSGAANLFSALFGAVSWWHLVSHRKKMKDEVLRIIMTHGENETKTSAAQKLLSLHFRQSFQDGKLIDTSRKQNLAKERDHFWERGLCPTCGRQKNVFNVADAMVQV